MESQLTGEGTDLSGSAPRNNAALTELQVAERLGLSVATLRAWRHRGKGPRFVRFGRAVRYLPPDLDEFIRASVVDAAASSRDLEEEEAL